MRGGQVSLCECVRGSARAYTDARVGGGGCACVRACVCDKLRAAAGRLFKCQGL